MDARGHIYEDEPEKIPAEDKARLAGYLRGRKDADREAMMKVVEAAYAEMCEKRSGLEE